MKHIDPIMKRMKRIVNEATNKKKFCKQSADTKELQFTCEQCKGKTFSSVGAMEHKRLYKDHNMKCIDR